jgi:cytochrome b6-f complex subunit 4
MSDTKPPLQEDSIPFFPDHVKTEFKVVVFLVVIAALVGVIGMVSPIGIGDPADPLNTPAHVKPEWYFLALYQLLKYIPKTLGVLIPIVALLILAIWPFLDPKIERTKRPAQLRTIAVIFVVILLIALTVWGEVS